MFRLQKFSFFFSFFFLISHLAVPKTNFEQVYRGQTRTLYVLSAYPAGTYLLRVNDRNSRTRCETCSKLTIKTPEQCHWRRSSVFFVNFEHISYLVLVFL